MSETHAAARPTDREIELKLAIGSPAARTAADRALGRAPERLVETIYYDTPHRRLHSAGYSLRLRRDGENWSQSVKGCAGIDRFEQERDLRGGLPDFSLLEGTPVASLVSVREGLSPMFVTRVRRRSRRRLADGSRIEFSLDEGEVIARDRSWPIHELELELKAGAPEALFDQGRRLAEGEAFTPAFMSKAERGFALVDGILGEPVKFGYHPLGEGMTVASAFAALARRCLLQLSLNADLLALGALRLEALHQARVGLRRLLVVMTLFKPLLGRAASEAIEAELRWLGGELAAARNLDVLLLETFQPQIDRLGDRAAGASLGHALLLAQERAYDRAVAALASPRFRVLLLETARWIETRGAPDPALGPGQAGEAVAKFAGGALDKRRHVLRRRLHGLDWDDPHARHRVRIAAKKMRYASEFFTDLGPADHADRYRPFNKALSAMQDGLGRLNDIAVAEPVMLAAVDEAPKERAPASHVGYAGGVIMGATLARQSKLMKAARRDAKTFLDAPVWW